MTALALFVLCLELSLVAVGGAVAVVPELQRQVVDVHHWMGTGAFGALFALAQAAPGPNVVVVVLVGWRVAGLWGAVAATAGILLPSSVVTWVAMGAWLRFRDRPWRAAVQAGLVPVTVGLVAAAAALLAEGAVRGWASFAVLGVVAAASFRTKVHPLWLLAGAAAAGGAGRF